MNASKKHIVDIIHTIRQKGHTFKELASMRETKVLELLLSYLRDYKLIETKRALTDRFRHRDGGKSWKVLFAKLASLEKFDYMHKNLATDSWSKWCNYIRTPQQLWELYNSEERYNLSNNALEVLVESVSSIDIAYFLEKIDDSMPLHAQVYYVSVARDFAAKARSLTETELLQAYLPKVMSILQRGIDEGLCSSFSFADRDNLVTSSYIVHHATIVDPTTALRLGCKKYAEYVSEKVIASTWDNKSIRQFFNRDRSWRSREDLEDAVGELRLKYMRNSATTHAYLPSCDEIKNDIVTYGYAPRINGYPANHARSLLFV